MAFFEFQFQFESLLISSDSDQTYHVTSPSYVDSTRYNKFSNQISYFAFPFQARSFFVFAFQAQLFSNLTVLLHFHSPLYKGSQPVLIQEAQVTW